MASEDDSGLSPSLDTRVRAERAPYSQTKQAVSAVPGSLERQIARAVREKSGATPCPNIAHPLFAFSRSSNKVVALPCGRWDCVACSRRKKAAARLAIEIGMSRAFAAKRRVRFITLTDTAEGAMTVADLYKNWNRLRIKLRRKGFLDQYAAAVELQERGALHLHLIATGRYLPQKKLKVFAVDAGWGEICDLREIKQDAHESDKRAASYVAKEMAGYVSKDGASLAEKTNVRRRPVRFSRDWGCSLTKATELIAAQVAEERDSEKDPGPWVIVRVAPDGTVLPMGGKGLPRAIPPSMSIEEGQEERASASDDGADEGAKAA